MPWATNSARPEHVEAEFPDGITVEQARCVLETGDIILFQGRYLVSSAYRWARGGDYYSHAAIVAEWDHDWILLQAEAAGVQAVELRNAVAQYNGLSDWYGLTDKCRQEIALDMLLREAKADLGLPFGVLEFLIHLTHWWLGLTSPKRSGHPKAFFCSQYVAHCFKKANIDLTGLLDSDTMPDDIMRSGWLQRMGPIWLD